MSAAPDPVFSTPEGFTAMMTWYDQSLARTSLDLESISLPTRYGLTHLIAAGPRDAPPVILLHGMEGNAASWRHLLPDFVGKFRLYAVDIIGSAGKSAPTRLAFDGQQYGAWLTDVLDGLHVNRAHFMGESNGCWLIFKLAAYAPHRIVSAVLISANGLVPVRFPCSLARLEDYAAVRAAKDRLAPTLVTRRFVRLVVTWAGIANADLDPDEVEWFYLLAKYYRFRFPPGPVRDDELEALKAPTLLLMGEREQCFNVPAAITRARRLIPHLEANVVLGVGHNMAIERRAYIHERLRQFLLAHPDSGVSQGS